MRLAVRVITLQRGHLTYQLAPGLPGDPTADIRKALQAVTGDHWQVECVADIADGTALPSLVEVSHKLAQSAHQAMMDDPLVKAAFAAFPGAAIVDEDSAQGFDRKPWSPSRSRHA
jgi:DNA polymerase-3 subunit gamma/tau